MTLRRTRHACQSPSGILLCISLFCSVSMVQAALPSATLAGKNVVQAFTGSSDVKFLFISGSDSNVYFVDYSEASPSLKLLEGMKEATLVDISPDGKWLTYQTGRDIEGPCVTACTTSLWIRPFTAAGSSVRIAQNGYVPRFVVGAVDTPTIIYSTAIDCPRDSFPPLIRRSVALCFESGSVLRVKTLNGRVLGATDTLFRGGSYYGGVSYDGRYLCTGWPGGVCTFMLDLKNSSTGPQVMHRVSLIDTAGQASFMNIGGCNISRSPSRIFTNTMLYYDFGLSSTDISNPLWGNWAVHGALFIARMGTSSGEPLRFYGLPPDQVITEPAPTALGKCIVTEWVNPEWSNHPYFATAALMAKRLWKPDQVYQQSDRAEAVYAINLKDRGVIRLVSTTDTGYTATFSAKYPALWVKVPSGFAEDPTWLSAPDANKSVPVTKFVPRKAATAHILLVNRTIASDKPLSGISVFSTSGALIWKTGVHGTSTTVHLPEVRPGVYFVNARFAAGTQVLRWVVR